MFKHVVDAQEMAVFSWMFLFYISAYAWVRNLS